jgi:hypothetical protein
MSPLSHGREMIPESLPHVLSLLYFVFGDGKVGNLHFEPEEGKMEIEFTYSSKSGGCDVFVGLVRKEGQPRDFHFGFNDRIVSRILDRENYDIHFAYENKKIRITDPLELSVRNFMGAVRENREPLIGCQHIMNNMSLVREIYNSYQAR